MKVEFTVHGEPEGKGRPRFNIVAGHSKPRTPDQTVIYENLIKTEYLLQCGQKMFPADAMLDLRVQAYYSIPASASLKKKTKMMSQELRPTKKPDADNVIKVVADSLNKVAYRDDAQIVDAQIRKFYGIIPKLVVTIRDIGGTKNERG